jgi:tyrosine-protein phosphatase YwqE
MHNTENRAPNIGAARERIIKNFGNDYWEYFEKNNRCLLENEEIDESACKNLTRKSFFYGFLGKNLKKT